MRAPDNCDFIGGESVGCLLPQLLCCSEIPFDPVPPLTDDAFDHRQCYAPQHKKQQAEGDRQPEYLAGKCFGVHLRQATARMFSRLGSDRLGNHGRQVKRMMNAITTPNRPVNSQSANPTSRFVN